MLQPRLIWKKNIINCMFEYQFCIIPQTKNESILLIPYSFSSRLASTLVNVIVDGFTHQKVVSNLLRKCRRILKGENIYPSTKIKNN